MRTIGTERLIGAGLVVLALALIGAATGINMNQVRTAAPGAVNVGGVAAAEGSSLAAARADHVHSLTGVLSGANGGLGAAQPACSAGQHVTCNGTNCSCTADTVGALPAGAGAELQVRASASTFGAYAGAACALPQVMTGISSTGSITCQSPSNVTGNAATASSLASNPGNCIAGKAPAGIAANGTAEGCFDVITSAGGSTGNLQVMGGGTSTLASYAGTSCTLPAVMVGLDASGLATCAQPSNVSGSAASATYATTAGAAESLALTATPAQCGAGQAAKGISANGAASGCFTPGGWDYNVPPAAAATSGIPLRPSSQVAWNAAGWSTTDLVSVTTPLYADFNPTARNTSTGAVTAGDWRWYGAAGAVAFTISDTGSFSGKAATATALATNGTNCSAGQAAAGVDASGNAEGCWTPSGGTMTRLTASWASSASANTLGVVGTGGVPMTSPTYSANAPFSVRCVIRTTRPATTNGPRYGLQTSGTFTALSATVSLGLAGTAPARTQNTYELTTAATASCAAGCTAAITTGTLAQAFNDIVEGTGQVGTSGTVSLVMAPSAAAANTAQIGSYCVWY